MDPKIHSPCEAGSTCKTGVNFTLTPSRKISRIGQYQLILILTFVHPFAQILRRVSDKVGPKIWTLGRGGLVARS